MKKTLLPILFVAGMSFTVKPMHCFSVFNLKKMPVVCAVRSNIIDDLLIANAERWCNYRFRTDLYAFNLLGIQKSKSCKR